MTRTFEGVGAAIIIIVMTVAVCWTRWCYCPKQADENGC